MTKEIPGKTSRERLLTFAYDVRPVCQGSLGLGLFFCSLMFSGRSQAQDTLKASTTRQEVWPEIDLYYRFNDQFRLYGTVSGTRLKSSSYTDGGLSINLDYFAFPISRKMKSRSDSARGRFLWLRGGFLYSTSPKDLGDVVKEYTIRTEANFRFYLPFEILLTNRNRFDWRFLNGNFQPRYRPRITIERDLTTDYLTFNAYIYAEYFINFTSNSQNRMRVCVGSELRITQHFNFEVYFVHQFENHNSTPTVNAVGLALKAYWQKGDPFFHKKVSQK